MQLSLEIDHHVANLTLLSRETQHLSNMLRTSCLNKHKLGDKQVHVDPP